MKKIFTTIITALTVCVLGAASVFAAGSSTGPVEVTGVTDGNGTYLNYFVTGTTVPLITRDIASAATGVPADQLQVLWQADVSAVSLPATVTYNANGTDGKTLYSFHWNGSSWELMNTGVGPTISTTYSSLSPVALVVKLTDGSSPAASGSSTDATSPVADSPVTTGDDATTSPRTGDFTAIIASVAVIAVAASATYVVASKKS